MNYILLFFLLLILFCVMKIFSKNTIDELNYTLINDKKELGNLLEKLKLKTGIEIGVQKGVFANMLLNKWKSCKVYIMVDPWLKQRYYDDYGNVNNEEQNRRFFNTSSVVNKYSNRTKFIIMRMKSKDAIYILKCNYFDFIYIDGRHDYNSVKNDINMYYPLVSIGGILAGHDYTDSTKALGNEWLLDENGNKNKQFKAVKSAVDEFVKRKKLKLTLIKDEFTSVWIIRKIN